MPPDDDAERPGLVTPVAASKITTTRQDRDQGTTTPWPTRGCNYSPTLTYLQGRERVLGRRAWVPLYDPEAGAERLADALGGRAAARGWLREALEAVAHG